MQEIKENILRFNQSGSEPFTLSASMGYTKFIAAEDDMESFMGRMDEKMYEAKRKYHQGRQKSPETVEAGKWLSKE